MLRTSQTKQIPIDPISNLDLHRVTATIVSYKSRAAVRIEGASSTPADGTELAVVRETDFQDGVIEVDLSGDTNVGADPSFRGFVGIAFRVAPDARRVDPRSRSK